MCEVDVTIYELQESPNNVEQATRMFQTKTQSENLFKE